MSESAPVDLTATVICFLPLEDSPDSLAKKHRTDVSISRRLPPGLGFFRLLSPGIHQPALRLACPPWRANDRELPRSAYQTSDHVGLLCPPAGMLSASDHVREVQSTRVPFWSKPISPSACSLFTAVTSIHVGWPYDLILTPHPDRASRRASASRLLPRIPRDASAHCLRGFIPAPAAPEHACSHRIAVTEHWVQAVVTNR